MVMVRGQFFTLAALILVIALISSAAVVSTVNQQNAYSVNREEHLKHVFRNIHTETIKFLELYLACYTQGATTPSVNNWTRSIVETYSERGIQVNISISALSPFKNWTSSPPYPNPGLSCIQNVQVTIEASDGSTTISEIIFCSITYSLQISTQDNQKIITFTRRVNITDPAGNVIINVIEGVDFAKMDIVDSAGNPLNCTYRGAGQYIVQSSADINVQAVAPSSGVEVRASG
ncbi:MAG: hypothetical protein ACTSXX_07525 [Candidatus Baldrarchaeia archaeon]